MFKKIHKLIDRFFLFLIVLIIALGFFIRVNGINQPARYIFDEDFHAFTAWQEIEHPGIMFQWWHPPYPKNISQYTYRPPAIEWLHPPVTKYIWITSIRWLGDNPLAWRLPSVIFGTINVALIIWLTLITTRQKNLSLLAGLILALERLSITQSQLANNDIILTSWIMFATIFYLLARTAKPSMKLLGINKNSKFEIRNSKQDLPSSSFLVPSSNFSSLIINYKLLIILSSIFLGFAIATKWTAFWVLPVFFIHFLFTQIKNRQRGEYHPEPARRHPEFISDLSRQSRGSHTTSSRDSEHFVFANAHSNPPASAGAKQLRAGFQNDNHSSFIINHTLLIILSSIFLFLILPIIIYFISYLPMLTHGQNINDFIKLHSETIHYQHTHQFNHPSASKPWQWAYGQKRIYYALKANGDSVNRVAYVNPILALILTGGLFVSLGIIFFKFIFVILKTRAKHGMFRISSTNFSFLIFNLALIIMLWLPWFFISRPKFIYHFTPIIPFLIVNLMLLANLLPSRKR